MPLNGIGAATSSRSRPSALASYALMRRRRSRLRSEPTAGVADFRIHDLRHTGATRTLRASKNLRAVKEMLGHADIKTTMRYAHVLVDDVAEAMTARVIDEAARRAAHESRLKSRENPEQSPEGVHKQPKQKGK